MRLFDPAGYSGWWLLAGIAWPTSDGHPGHARVDLYHLSGQPGTVKACGKRLWALGPDWFSLTKKDVYAPVIAQFGEEQRPPSCSLPFSSKKSWAQQFWPWGLKTSKTEAIGDQNPLLEHCYHHMTNLFDTWLLFQLLSFRLSWTTWQTSACLDFGGLPGFSLQQSISAVMAVPQFRYHSSCDSKTLEKLYFLLIPIIDKTELTQGVRKGWQLWAALSWLSWPRHASGCQGQNLQQQQLIKHAESGHQSLSLPTTHQRWVFNFSQLPCERKSFQLFSSECHLLRKMLGKAECWGSHDN